MTIKYIRFMQSITFEKAPGGTDYWSPAKFEGVTAAKRDGGIVLSYTHMGEASHVHVPMTNVASVTYTEDGPAPAKKGA